MLRFVTAPGLVMTALTVYIRAGTRTATVSPPVVRAAGAAPRNSRSRAGCGNDLVDLVAPVGGGSAERVEVQSHARAGRGRVGGLTDRRARDRRRRVKRGDRVRARRGAQRVPVDGAPGDPASVVRGGDVHGQRVGRRR